MLISAFATTIFTVDNLGFHWVKLKPTGPKALLQHFQHVPGFFLTTAVHQTIISISTPGCIRVMNL
jgi:hypothetical protein